MNLQIQAIPAFKDNYLWLMVHPEKLEALVGHCCPSPRKGKVSQKTLDNPRLADR